MSRKFNLLLLSIVAFIVVANPALSLTRQISSTHDNIYTFIRNSNGNYWKANSSNIQKAINDLDNTSGTVWLPGNKTFWISSTIIVWENIILDMLGAEFAIGEDNNITVVELKNGAGIKNGVIDASGQITWHVKNSTFGIPNACIILNASSYIESALIENMILESISAGYEEADYYDDNHYGSGYGIYFSASNTSSPQMISGVKSSHIKLRSFKIGIYLNNERHPIGSENSAFIQSNSFEFVWFYAVSYGIVLSRNSNVPKDKCVVSNNNFDMMQYQTGRGSYWGGEYLSHEYLHIEGYGNCFTNCMLWDYTASHQGSGPAIDFASDSENCYLQGFVSVDGWLSWGGSSNTLFKTGSEGDDVTLRIGKIYELTG